MNFKEFEMNKNKKIIEFARAAGVIGVSETTVAPSLEKFAELIVQECAELCYNEDYFSGSGYGEEIYKRFGL